MKAQDLKSSVLQLAIQGKLVEQNPNDEPASILLEKIKAEKEQLIKEKKIKREKPLPEISEEEKPFEIPESWEWIRLGSIGQTCIGLTYSPSDIVNDGITVLRSNNINNGKVNLNEVVKVNKIVNEKLIIQKKDILICSRNGSRKLVGKSAIINELGIGMTFGAFMAIYRSKCNDYISYFLQSPLFRQQLDGCRTTTINQLTQDVLRNIYCPLPPLDEQKRIVDKLESLMKYADKLQDKIDNKGFINNIIKVKNIQVEDKKELISN